MKNHDRLLGALTTFSGLGMAAISISLIANQAQINRLTIGNLTLFLIMLTLGLSIAISEYKYKSSTHIK